MSRTSGGQHVFAEALDLQSGQIIFPATQSASANANTLDDYEEGAWTVEIGDDNLDGCGETQVYDVQVGRYTNIGNRIFFSFRVRITNLGGLTTSEGARIVGLPFTAAGGGGRHGIAIGSASSFAIADGASVSGTIEESSSVIQLNLSDTTAGTTQLLISELSAGGLFEMCGNYEV